MSEFERNGWKIKKLTFNRISRTPKLNAFIQKGDDSMTPAIDAPDNLLDMKFSEVIELIWREKDRITSN